MGGGRESWIEMPTRLTFSICIVRKAKSNAEWARPSGNRGYVCKYFCGGLPSFYNASTVPKLATATTTTVYVTATVNDAFMTTTTIKTNSDDEYPGGAPAVLLHSEVHDVTVDPSLRLKCIPRATLSLCMTRV